MTPNHFILIVKSLKDGLNISGIAGNPTVKLMERSFAKKKNQLTCQLACPLVKIEIDKTSTWHAKSFIKATQSFIGAPMHADAVTFRNRL